MMKSRYLFHASLALLSPVMGQIAVEPPPRPAVAFIVPAKAEKDQAIEIAEAAVHTRLAGALAETTVTLVFHNPNSRAMEGELSYPLPPDATLQGYALDVNGRMVDGVPVPRQKARVAFEAEQREGIDPGLAEWSGGNRFKTRVSPIPAHGQRTITLRYTTMVQQNGAAASYRLPLDFDRVGSFRLRVEALTTEQPQVQPGGLGNLAFAPWQKYFVLEREWKNLALKEDLVIDLPQGMAEAPAVEQYEGQFYLARLVTLPAQEEGAALPGVAELELVWDASGSMERVDKAPILELLRLYFAARPQEPCTVRLRVVRDAAEPVREFRVEQGNATELLEALKAIRYDGATGDLAASMSHDAPLRLLVTDGHVNFAEAPASPGKGAICALVASSGVDQAALRRWGATPIDLLRQTPQQALAAPPSWQLKGVELDGQPWADAFTSAPDGVVQGSVLLTGTLPAGRHEVTLVFAHAQVEQRVSVAADTAEAAEGRLNRSFFAQNKLAALLLEPESPARDVLLRQLGEEFGIVTPGTSLLVLESLEQYLRHEVRPPACCPELRARYDEMIASASTRNAHVKESSLSNQKERARLLRAELQQWYEKDFSAVKPKRPSFVRRVARAALGARAEGLGVAQEAAFLTAEPETAELSSRASRSEVAPTVVVSSGAAPVSMATVEVEAEDLEEESSAEEEYFGAPAPAPAPAVVQNEAEEGEEEEEGAPAPAPVVPQCEVVNREMGEAGAGGPPAPAVNSPAIRVQAWSSEAPYLALLKAAADPVATYYEQRLQHADSPGFFLDCADFFEQAGHRAMAVRALSNLLEMDLENRSLMRAAASKLRYMGETQKAILIYRKVQELFAEEPQSHRDLALAYADAGRWQEAVDTMRLVFDHPMDARFYGMEQIAAVELANIVARAQRAGKPVVTEGIPEAYLKPLEVDVRVVINWDTDMSDMDLWVTDLYGERCYYGHQLTSTGGHLSRDVTQGYGPEEFLIRQAHPGRYKVQAHYYGTRSMKMLAPVTLYAELYTDYGRPQEKRQTLIFRLDGEDQVVHIANLDYKADPAAPATRDYQVRAGETWDSIAQKELGSAARAGEIISLNPGASAEVPPAKGSIIRLPEHGTF